MARQLYGIMVRWEKEPTIARVNDIDAALGRVGDWLRFSSHNWVVWTEGTAVIIYNELRSILTQNDSELILRLDVTDYTGWAPPWVDQWIKSKAPGYNALLAPPPPPPSVWKP